jgi:Predicted membrane protein (DUF2127)
LKLDLERRRGRCEQLDRILQMELAGVIYYTHYSFMIYGHARIPITSWLRENATPQKANDQPELNNSVAEQIECHELLRANGKILDRREQRVCNYVVRVFSKFFLGYPRRLWYYPVAIIVFALFIAYQLYRYTFSHSVWLLLITALDIIVIALTWHEYRFMRAPHQAAASG